MADNFNQINECKPTYYTNHINAPTIPHSDNLSSSLDRIASVINCDDGQHGDLDEHSATVIDGYNQQPVEYNQEPQSSYSLSDESFVVSSGTSLTSASYMALSGSERDKDEDKEDSATNREDSGVLDMKDLEGQLNNSYENDGKLYNNHYHDAHNQRLEQEKPSKSISNNIMASNLINKSPQQDGNQNHHHNQANYINTPYRFGKPTEVNESNIEHHRSRRSMSASLPIQVPARRMRKDLNKMKLKLMKEEDQSLFEIQDSSKLENNALVAENEIEGANTNSSNTAWDDEIDDDAFLDQEYNKNHHNHYPINEHDDEHLRAGEDPMRLFASIQALAKSLHEDAELFGSLPPKRLLERPVRSIALV